MTTRNVRPKFLNLFRIHLPITGIVSFAHRISGALLVISLPLVVLLFAYSLQSQQSFEQVTTLLSSYWGRGAMVLIFWALLSHLLSGVRFLLLDMDIGIRLLHARASAWSVAGLALLVLILLVSGVNL
ncbi:succinate dehydrogenase, cytochrome b556 subunit [Thiohalophilus sp.]|uniref:succinate dehydrogenase, cytochrome b556 subunit n=1 Tax=Thiohalophilus sp. TaxID=3028392 RepID=UPI0039757A5B